ncbi:ClC family H(+)/Cl(-) exchange transporter [Streptococcus halichoeri]|uniref:ClC family H(+)/Cl(-) exchange transporter n=1 Tax=Streptococcus halichoeri TaxID=254785 RepID=UPI001359DB5C|nr:ClC family H(+)/Cl(-) exchange transporter [Streptococcus halichoeri]
MENHQREYQFSNESIIAFVWRGALVGLIAGIVVSLFRLIIEKVGGWVIMLYHQSHQLPYLLILITLGSALAVVLAGYLAHLEPDIKGSGIPHVEGELKGLLSPNWWSVLWKKFLGGILGISVGFMLGREGPSIQLGAMSAKGLAKRLGASHMERRVMIASGAAAGLSAAFNAPIAGLLFVVEEIYHHFSRLIWISALVASLVANIVSLKIFGLTPVLAMPSDLPTLTLKHYWLLLILGLSLGCLGYYYEVIILKISQWYQSCASKIGLPTSLQALLTLPFIIMIGYYLPILLGGGHQLILQLAQASQPIMLLLVYFIIRFVISMLSFGSGLPGGIFLPILTLGGLAGLIIGSLFIHWQLIDASYATLFIVLGMAGYFAAVSKAPLTGMILVTEMVGDFKPLMAIAVVTFVAYVMMDLLNGHPIYEAMLDKMTIQKPARTLEPTLIELTVTDKIAGKQVKDLNLPMDVLITTQLNHHRTQVVTGNTQLEAGATIFVVVNQNELGQVRELLM